MLCALVGLGTGSAALQVVGFSGLLGTSADGLEGTSHGTQGDNDKPVRTNHSDSPDNNTHHTNAAALPVPVGAGLPLYQVLTKEEIADLGLGDEIIVDGELVVVQRTMRGRIVVTDSDGNRKIINPSNHTIHGRRWR